MIKKKEKLEQPIFYLLPQNSDFARFNVTFVLKIQTVVSYQVSKVKREARGFVDLIKYVL